MHPEIDTRLQRRPEAGFSLVETLIAALLLLFIVVGVLPLFSRSMLNNVQGNDASNVANAAVDGFEQLFTVPFTNQLLRVPGGVTELQRDQVYSLQLNRWILPADLQAGDQAQYRRRLTLRQFSFEDIASDGTLDSPLDGAADPANVHLKLFDFVVENNRTVGAPPYRIRALQAF